MNKKHIFFFIFLGLTQSAFADKYSDAVKAINNNNKSQAAKLVSDVVKANYTTSQKTQLKNQFFTKFGMSYEDTLKETQQGPATTPTEPKTITKRNVTETIVYQQLAKATLPNEKAAQAWIKAYRSLETRIRSGELTGNLSGLDSQYQKAKSQTEPKPSSGTGTGRGTTPSTAELNTANNAARKAFAEVIEAASSATPSIQNQLAKSWGFEDFTKMTPFVNTMKNPYTIDPNKN